MKIVLAWMLFFLSSLTTAQEVTVTQQTLGNYRLETTNDGKNSIGRLFFPKESRDAFFQLERSSEEAPFAGFQLIKIGNTGSPKLEVTGLCSQVCEHDLYHIANQRVEKIFSGAYSSIRVYQGQYIISGGSGCCAEEVHVFDAPLRLESKPTLIFLINRMKNKCEIDSKTPSKRARKIAHWLCSL